MSISNKMLTETLRFDITENVSKLLHDSKSVATELPCLIYPFTARYYFSIPLQNIGKPKDFLFSPGMQKQHRAVMG